MRIDKLIPSFSILLILVFTSAASSFFRNPYSELVLLVILVSLNNIHSSKSIIRKNVLTISILWLFYNILYFLFYGVISINSLGYIIISTIIAQIIININGKDLVFNISNVIYKLSLLSLIFYVLQIINFSSTYTFIKSIQNFIGIDTSGFEIKKAYSSIFIYTIADFPAGVLNLRRNFGFMWEPGGFATIVVTGFILHLSLNTFNLKDKKAIIFLLTIFTTFSTTGYIALLVIFSYYIYINFKGNLSSIITIFITVLITYSVLISGIVTEKLQLHYETGLEVSDVKSSRESSGSLGRFGGLLINFKEYSSRPIFGHYFDKTDRIFDESMASMNGLGNFLVRYGTIGIIILFIGYFKTAKSLFPDKLLSFHHLFVIVLLINAFAFNLIRLPFFFLFIVYGYLNPRFINQKKRLN